MKPLSLIAVTVTLRTGLSTLIFLLLFGDDCSLGFPVYSNSNKLEKEEGLKMLLTQLHPDKATSNRLDAG